MIPVDDESLEVLSQRALAIGAPPPAAPKPKEESLDDLASTAMKAVKDREEVVFKERQKRLGIPIIPKDGQAVTAAAMGVVGGLVKGLFTPIASFMPDSFNDKLDAWEEDSVRKMLGLQAKSENKALFEASPTISRMLAGAPGFVGEMAGMAVPATAALKTTKTLMDVEKSATLLGRVGKSLLAGTASGTMFSAAAKLDPGESRWSRVAQDSVMFGAFELVGIPAIRRAWMEETPGLAESISKATGADVAKTAEQITSIRAGIPASPEVLEAVIDAAKKDPTLAKKPVVLQAVKQREARKRVQSPTTVIDAGIQADSPHFVARLNITANGQPVQSADVVRLPGMTDADVAKQVEGYKASMKQLMTNGVDVRVESVVAGDNEGAQLVLNTLQGRSVKPPNPDKAKRKVPGAAPPASVAESGIVPGEGAVVNIAEPGKPVVQAKVVQKVPKADLAPDMTATEEEKIYQISMQRQGEATLAQKKFVTLEDAPDAPDYMDARSGKAWRQRWVNAQNKMLKAPPAVEGETISEYQKRAQVTFSQAEAQVTGLKGKTKAERKADAVAMQAEQESKVTVEMEDKTVKQVPLAHVQIPLEVGVKQSVTLKPHLDGTDRRAIIHLDDGQISFESVGGSRDPSQNYFQSGMFDEVNRDVQWGNDPRLYIQKDGVVISIPTFPEAQRVTRRSFLKKGAEVVEKTQERTKGQVAEEILGSDKPFVWDPELKESQEAYEQIAQAIPKGLRKHPAVVEYFEESGDFLWEHSHGEGGITSESVLTDLKMYIQNMEKPDTKLVKNIDKILKTLPTGAPLEGSVEMVTAKRAAMTMLGNGIAGNTKVKVTSARMSHDPGAYGSFTTLKELADTQLPLANMSKLADDAAERGLKVAPFGTQVTLTSKSGFSRQFANSLEAHEAVLRMPTSSPDVKIEASLERAWKMGSERAWDPDIDINRYVPVAAQEAAFQELVDGKRPLTLLYTTDQEALVSTIRQVEKGLGAKPDTLRIQMLPALDDAKRMAAVVYRQDQIALMAAKYRDALRYLGVDAKDPADIIRQLSLRGKGHGIYVVSGRDPYSAALYAKWRDNGNKEFWERGRIELDSLGPYRRYTAQEKAVIKYPGAGTEDEVYHAVDLADSFGPPATNFSPDSSYKPRPAEEVAKYEPRWTPKEPPSKQYMDTGGALTYMTNRLRPMMELAKDLQVRTGAPFYEWYRSVEVAREKLTRAIFPHMNQVSELARGLNKTERQSVQLLIESPQDAELLKRLSPKVIETAGKMQKLYEQFFYDQNFSVRAVRELFDSFPHIRKADGNFRYAMRGRSAIPEIAQLLSKDLENGVIAIDGRELDFQRIANRLIRSTATERIMQPPWKMVKTEMEAWAEARRIPGDYAAIFHRYLREVLHMPDDLHMSLSRMTKKVFEKLGGRMTELEAEDSVTMFSQMNYFTNLAWRPGTAAKNLLQVVQTTFPIMGTDTFAGYKKGLRWWKDKALQEEMVQRGIVSPDGVYGPMAELARLTETGGKVGRTLDVFFNKGTRWHANTDDFNRVVAYWSQYEKGMRFAKQYKEGKINWAEFLEKSQADMRDAAGGPFTNELKVLMDTKGPESAISRLSEEFAKATQFVYTRGNSPYVMQSTAGRFFLQYGTWPAWYAENLRSMLVRGSKANRVKALARWTAVQGVMFGTAAEMFGVDLSRWVFFSPLGYSGGPAAQLLMQGSEVWSSAVDPSNNDPVARIAKARFLKGLMRQATPLPLGAFSDMMKTIDAFDNADLPGATRAMLGLPPTNPQSMRQLQSLVP